MTQGPAATAVRPPSVSPASMAPLMLGVGVAAVSVSGILIREADDGFATVVWVRLGLSTLLLLPWFLHDVRRGRAPRTRGDWGVVLGSGAFLAAHFLSWTASLAYTSVASSVLLVCTSPVLVAILGRRLLGESVPRRVWVGIALAMLGTAVTAGGDLRLSGRALYGDLLALAGAVFITGYLLIGRGVRRRFGAAGYSLPCYAVTTVVGVAAVPLTGAALVPSSRTLIACVGLAVICTIGGHTVFNWTLAHLRAVTVSLALLGEPPATALLAIPILHERPPGATLVGGAVILAGLAIALSEPPPETVVAPITPAPW